MFKQKYNGTKLKVTLKLAINRVGMLQKKKENQSQLTKKEIAELLKKERPQLARIKTEQIIRDDSMIEALEMLEVYFNLLVSRFGLIDAVKTCDAGIREAVCTVIWAAPYLQSEIPEVKQIAGYLGGRYGKEFIQEALANTPRGDGGDPERGWVCERVMSKLRLTTPSSQTVTGYLLAIAKSYKVEYNPLESLPTSQEVFDPNNFPDAPGAGGSNNGNNGFIVPNTNNNNPALFPNNIDPAFLPSLKAHHASNKDDNNYPPPHFVNEFPPPPSGINYNGNNGNGNGGMHDPALFPPAVDTRNNYAPTPHNDDGYITKNQPNDPTYQGKSVSPANRPLPTYPPDEKKKYEQDYRAMPEPNEVYLDPTMSNPTAPPPTTNVDEEVYEEITPAVRDDGLPSPVHSNSSIPPTYNNADAGNPDNVGGGELDFDDLMVRFHNLEADKPQQ